MNNSKTYILYFLFNQSLVFTSLTNSRIWLYKESHAMFFSCHFIALKQQQILFGRYFDISLITIGQIERIPQSIALVNVFWTQNLKN